MDSDEIDRLRDEVDALKRQNRKSDKMVKALSDQLDSMASELYSTRNEISILVQTLVKLHKPDNTASSR